MSIPPSKTKENISKYNKNYRDSHQDIILRNRVAVKDQSKEYSKEYYKNNTQYFAEYYRNNIDKIKEKERARSSVMLTCDCGAKVKRGSMYSHLKTAKHITFINMKKQIDACQRCE